MRPCLMIVPVALAAGCANVCERVEEAARKCTADILEKSIADHGGCK